MHFPLDISIHAPVKGATGIHRFPLSASCDFNPRTREGCDAGIADKPFNAVGISIHAPVKGATENLRMDFGDTVEFQSTHP